MKGISLRGRLSRLMWLDAFPTEWASALIKSSESFLLEIAFPVKLALSV
jgi:hypothetical protein